MTMMQSFNKRLDDVEMKTNAIKLLPMEDNTLLKMYLLDALGK